MTRAFLLFDFGADEEAVQKARHRVQAWKQAFRLGDKVQFKLERQSSGTSGNSRGPKDSESKGKRGQEKEGSASNAETIERIRFLVRLDFSTHEKHLFQTWFDRIPGEEPFKSKKPEAILREASNFEQVSDLFDSLD